MPDSPASFGAPYVLQLSDGEQITIPILKMRQIAVLQGELNAARVASLRKYLTESKATPVEIGRQLASVELTPISLQEIQIKAETPEGALWVLGRALNLSGDALDTFLAKLEPTQVLEAAVRATGWVPAPKEAKPGTGGPANPPATDAK